MYHNLSFRRRLADAKRPRSPFTFVLVADAEVAADGEGFLLDLRLLFDLGLEFVLGRTLRLAFDPLRTGRSRACRFALRAPGLSLAVAATGARYAAVFLLAVGTGIARRAGAFRLPVRARVAVRTLAFQLAVRTGVAHRAAAFHLAMGAGVACRAAVFYPAVRAGVAVRARDALRAVTLQLAVRAWVAVRTVVFQLAVRTRVTVPAFSFLPPVRASLHSHGSRATTPRAQSLVYALKSWSFFFSLFPSAKSRSDPVYNHLCSDDLLAKSSLFCTF